MRGLLLLSTIMIFSHTAHSYDYLKHSGITTEEESCRMYREFDLQECKRQAATVKDHFNQPRCDMWSRQRERALADCDGTSEKTKIEKKHKEAQQALRRNATHILVEKGRLVCRSEKSFRNTYNYVISQQPGTPPHLLSKVCTVLQYETIVKIDKESDDKKVAKITYMDNYGAIRYGFTALMWLVTKDKFKEITEKRKKKLM